MTTISDRLLQAQQRIELAAKKSNREAGEITLLAVSKTKPISQIEAAYQAGQRKFGENYVQEGVDKITQMQTQYPDIEWHFIGPLQSNKSKLIAEHFDWMHTLDRDKIAQRLASQRPSGMAPLNVCIQVNISQEQSKSGIAIDDIEQLADKISQMPQLNLRGLMAIPTATDDLTIQQHECQQLNNAFLKLKQRYPMLDTLSIGMSNDLEIAIANGSTMVRIGSAIFGARDYQ
ncbi:YggS family pyridoxal phosphate-dependent enzyme [Shewanella marina]|uniref:YggS family pyridoxal phosphate-dependent enzyme n=1 Tax=Shewanella marina TaxID=487319 RepID=UPI00046E919E|nr:YggS family pyridoxal phosphate-dependent enzyme [Shewanella marina]